MELADCAVSDFGLLGYAICGTIIIIMALHPFVGLGRFCSLLILYAVGRLLGQVVSLSQGRYVHTEQHKHRINAPRLE
jgi:hypothetical protein